MALQVAALACAFGLIAAGVGVIAWAELRTQKRTDELTRWHTCPHCGVPTACDRGDDEATAR